MPCLMLLQQLACVDWRCLLSIMTDGMRLPLLRLLAFHVLRKCSAVVQQLGRVIQCWSSGMTDGMRLPLLRLLVYLLHKCFAFD